MNRRIFTTLFVGLLAVALSVSAITPSDDLLIAGAARTNTWRSDLYINNPGQSRVVVNVMWLIRDQANPMPATEISARMPRIVQRGARLMVDPLCGLVRWAGATTNCRRLGGR